MVLRAFGSVGGYRLQSELGRGSYGAVYKAQHERTGEVVALKLLARADDGGKSLERFRREGQLLTRVPPHPNLVRIRATGEHDGLPYIAMELIEGRPLDQALADGPLSPERAARLVERIALALDHLHRSGVVHRDVTPKNVLMDSQGSPRLVDFGLALDLRRKTRLTNTQDGIVGVGHLAPEQVLTPGEVGPPADVYGAGALLYELLAGRPIHAGIRGYEELVLAMKSGKPDFERLPPSTPPALAKVLETALARRPQDRFRSAAALARAIDLAFGGRDSRRLEPRASLPSFEEKSDDAETPLDAAEQAFADALESRGIVVGDELARLLRMREALGAVGKPESLETIVVKRGLVSRETARDIASGVGLAAEESEPAPTAATPGEPVKEKTTLELELDAPLKSIQVLAESTRTRAPARSPSRRALVIALPPLAFALVVGTMLLVREARVRDLEERAGELEKAAREPWERARPFEAALASALEAEKELLYESAVSGYERALAARPRSAAARAGRARSLLGAARFREGALELLLVLPSIGAARDVTPDERAATWVALADLRLLYDESRTDEPVPGLLALGTAVQAAERARAADDGPLSRVAFARAIVSAGRVLEGKRILAGVPENAGDARARAEQAAGLFECLLLLPEKEIKAAHAPEDVSFSHFPHFLAAGSVAALLLSKGEPATAAQAFAELTRRAPRAGIFWLGLARAEVEKEEFESAQEHLSRAGQAEEPAQDEALSARLGAVLGTGGAEPQDARTWFERGLRLASKGEPEAALRAGRAALEKLEAGLAGTPPLRGDEAHLLVARMLAFAGRAEPALEEIERGLRRDARSVPLLLLKLLLLVEESRFEEALATSDELLAQGAKPAEPELARTSLLRELGRFDEAVADARADIAESPKDAGAHGALVRALFEAGRYEDAVVAAQAARSGKVALAAFVERDARLASRLSQRVAPLETAPGERSRVEEAELGERGPFWTLSLDSRADPTSSVAPERGAGRHVFGKLAARVRYSAPRDVAGSIELKLASPVDVSRKRALLCYELAEDEEGAAVPPHDLSFVLRDAQGKEASFRREKGASGKEGWQRVSVPLAEKPGGGWVSSRDVAFDPTMVACVRVSFRLLGDGPLLLWIDGVHFE